MPLNKSKRNLIYTIVAIALGLSLGTLLYFYFFQASPQDPNLITYEETKYENISVYTQENILNEGRSLLHISYPVSENEAVNTVIEDIAEDFVAEFEEVAKSQEESYQAYKKETGLVAVSLVAEYIQHFDVSFASDKYLLFLIHQYRSTGGTGSDDVVSLLFDRQSGKQLSLSHLFSSDKYLEVLSEKSREVLEEKALSDAALSDFAHEAHYQEWVELTRAHIKNGTEPIKENFDSFDIVDNKDLHIIFDKYQVGPGSDGVISVAIPLSELADILSDEMREIFNVELVLKDKSHEEKDDEPLAKGEESGQPQEEPETSPRGDNEDVDCSIDSCVALTFDDGPSIYTDKLLDILKENEVKATFFVLGRSAKIQGNTIRRMVAEGHDIGNHSYDHKNLKTLDEEGIAFQIKESSELIARLSDYQVELLRPPYGAYNQEVVDMVNMPIILWSIDPEDWKDRDKDLVLARMSEAKSGDIILAHDIYPTTIEAIPELIATLKAKGLVFVSISDLVGAHNLKPGAVIRARGLIM